MAHRARSFWLLPIIVLGFSVLGGVYGNGVQAAMDQPGLDESGVSGNVLGFTKFYSLVEQNFATPLDADKAIYAGAIPGMAATLDPHTTFFDPRAYRSFLDEQKGRYFGVGMEVGPRNNKTVVLAPFPGSPAYRVGIRPGDVLVTINDKSTNNLTTNEIADLLKGQRGTSVKIVVSREGEKDFLPFTVIREEINRKSVPDGFFVGKGIGYIKITGFEDDTSRGLDDNLKRLGQDGLQGLILDLRTNPGGLLDEAVDVAGAFLPKGTTVVSAHGRAYSPKAYTVRAGARGAQYPIVVLVNAYSASAAEIVSGALQDHDRAWIMGETTFGKGLVQTVFPLSSGTAIALTTAHFFTPSGRLIQRDYSHESFYDYYNHKDGITRNANDVKMTDSGRTVYGGGGITPDEEYKTPSLDPLEAELYRNSLFSFTRWYFSKHSSKLPAGWVPDQPVIESLRDYLLDRKVDFKDTDFMVDQDWIKRQLTKEMYIYAFDVDASDKIFAETDPEVKKAIESMPKAAALVENARKVMAKRRQ
jgi:carboxyl-terminal processing protease